MSILRRLIAAAAALLLVPALAACGFNEQTDAVYQASTGTNARNGDVWILNATIVSAKDGSGTFAGTLVNQTETDTVTLLSVTGASTMPRIVVKPNRHVNLAKSGAVRIELGSIAPGKFIELTFEFDNGETTKFKVPVVTHTGDYADVPTGKQATKKDAASEKGAQQAEEGAAKQPKADQSPSAAG